MESRYTLEKIYKVKGWFLEKIDKIGILWIRVIKKKKGVR